MTDQETIDALADQLDADNWKGARFLADELVARCDRAGVLSVRPVQLAKLLRALRGLAAQLDTDGDTTLPVAPTKAGRAAVGQ